MKKIFAMSVFALTSLTVFGGNIETKNSTKNSESEIVDQIGVLRCYRFEISKTVIVNHNPSGSSVTILDEYGLYTEQGFQARSQELYDSYISYVNPTTGNGVLYLHGHNSAAVGNCVSISLIE